MQKLKVISIDISTGTYASFIDNIIKLAASNTSSYVCVANVHMLVEAHKATSFADVVNQADITTPDGQPITWALRLLHGVKQDRVAGMDLLPDLLKRAQADSVPVFFYGGSQKMLDETNRYIKIHYPRLINAGYYSPPFRELSDTELSEISELINKSGAKLVFVILGCPKQEKWMASMKRRISATMIGIGGALPVMIGMQKRAPEWMQKAGLEWFYRLLQEPGRLFRRYAVTNSIFIVLLIKAWIRSKLK